MIEEFFAHLSDWVLVVITFVYAITTIAICIANYKSTKVAKDQLAEAKRASKEAEEYYRKSLAQQTTDSRIARMPYFYLSDKMDLGVRNNRLTLRIRLENCGNGSAVHIRLVTKQDKEKADWPIAYENEVHEFPYIQSDVLSSDFARIDSTIGFELTRYREDADTTFADRVDFEIEFQDMLGNTYRESFCLTYIWYGDSAEPKGQLGYYYSNKPTLQEKFHDN